MMFFIDDKTVASASDDEFWSSIEKTFELAEETLLNIYFETEEDARNGTYRSALDPEDFRIDTQYVHRFRRSDDRANIEAYRNEGVELLPSLQRQIERREINQDFAHNWGKLMFCFGFTAVGVFATGNDAASLRAGKAGGEAKQAGSAKKNVWFAKLIVHFLQKGGSLKAAQNAATKHIQALKANNLGSFSDGWLDVFLNADDLLKDTYTKMGKSKLHDLAARDDVPEVPPLMLTEKTREP
jgi:hypothetical protein